MSKRILTGIFVVVLFVVGIFSTGFAQTAEITIQNPADDSACGMTGELKVLLLGIEESNPPLGADLVRLAEFDFDQGTIKVTAYSRDLWVEAVSERLGKSYDTAMKAGKDAAEELKAIFADSYGVTVDGYVAMSIDDLPAVLDSIGEIKMFIPETIVTDRNFHFLVGEIMLDGELASEYVRANEPYGDLGRTRRQNLFVDSLMEKLKAEPENIVVLLDAVKAVLLTDLDDDTLSSLVCLADSVEKESITYVNY